MGLGNGSDAESLEFTFKYNPPVDVAVAERVLKEVKEILNGLGIVFLLSSGTCLGAVRDGAIIVWDDDLDIMSVIGANGLTDAKVDVALAVFRDRGYFIYAPDGAHRAFSMIKDYVRIGWDCYACEPALGVDQQGENSVLVYPKQEIPLRLLIQPKEIAFLAERFLVPNPPEEYLRLKYGEAWRTPKRAGEYELDAVEKIPGKAVDGSPCKLRVLDDAGEPVAGAEVVLVGWGRSTTNTGGYTEVMLPRADWYALVIRFPGHEQVLYMERLKPEITFVYRADSAAKAAEVAGGTVGTLGNLLTRE